MSIADLAAAKDATIALLAALVQRDRTGRGQHIDISLAHSILFLNEFASALLTPGTKAPKSGSTPQAIFTTSDGHRFSAGNPVSGQVFATLCRSFGCPELIEDERFVDTGRRRERRAELLAELQAALLRQGGIDEVEAVLDAAGLAVGRIRSVADVPATAWATERGAVVTAEVDAGQWVTLPSAPWRMSGAPPGPTPTMHPFGADNDDVLAELLALDDATIATLHADGVLLGDPATTSAGQVS
jgi:crotonobetainyl-CoA:carnitine CoA-transferase CaiB-like acyl-CoA transferase